MIQSKVYSYSTDATKNGDPAIVFPSARAEICPEGFPSSYRYLDTKNGNGSELSRYHANSTFLGT